MRYEEKPTTASIEFAEILEDLKIVEKGDEPLIQALFFDQYPLWRKHRYQLILNALKIDITADDPKEVFIRYLTNLRKALSHSKNDPLLQQKAFDFFTNTSLHSFCKEVVQLLKKSRPQNSVDRNLQERLKTTRLQIDNAPRSLKIPLFASIVQFLRGQLNINFDPYTQENTPYKLFDLPSLPVLRLGTPTYEDYFASITKKAKITKEFLGFIDFLANHGKKLLYVNLQNRTPSWIGRNEAPKCFALESLSRSYPNTLYLITLAKNTLFYHQEGPYALVDEAIIFRENLFFELRSKEGGFYFKSFPELIESDKIFEQLFAKVYKSYFHEKPSLTLQERLDFIELFYLEIEKYCIAKVKPHFVNLTCKDGIDRAGGANALLYFDTFLKNKETLTEDEIQDLEAVLFGPAILVKKRPITKNRFERFCSAIKTLKDEAVHEQ